MESFFYSIEKGIFGLSSDGGTKFDSSWSNEKLIQSFLLNLLRWIISLSWRSWKTAGLRLAKCEATALCCSLDAQQ